MTAWSTWSNQQTISNYSSECFLTELSFKLRSTRSNYRIRSRFVIKSVSSKRSLPNQSDNRTSKSWWTYETRRSKMNKGSTWIGNCKCVDCRTKCIPKKKKIQSSNMTSSTTQSKTLNWNRVSRSLKAISISWGCNLVLKRGRSRRCSSTTQALLISPTISQAMHKRVKKCRRS